MNTSNHHEQLKTASRHKWACGAPGGHDCPKKVPIIGACLACIVGLSLLGYSSCGGPDPDTVPEERASLNTAESLRGILYCAKSCRLALHWEDGDFELWDTGRGRRLGRVQRLSRPIAWCVASPDEETILTGDRMPNPVRSATDREALNTGFIPKVSVWDAKSGQQKHTIPIGEEERDPLWTREWHAEWLDKSRALIIRLWRENPARGASWLQITTVDTERGKPVRESENFKFIGERVLLSPDRKLALVMDDNHMRRGNAVIRGNARKISIIDLDTMKIISSWPEPADSGDKDTSIVHSALWCPEGKNVLTVKWGRPYAVRLWDARSARLLDTFLGHTDNVLDVAVTAAGDKILTASEDRTVRIWDVRTGKALAVLSGHGAGLNQVVVLPGDKWAVSAAEEPVAKVWDLTASKLKFDLPGHDSAVRQVEAVSDTVVRTVTLRGTATTWDCSTGKRLQVISKPPDFPKHFGVCELAEEEGTLHMRTKKMDKKQEREPR